MNLDRARLQFHRLAVARQIIGPLALDLDGGVLRRGLLDDADELRQQVLDGLDTGPDFAGFDNPALGIVGVAFLAPGDREAIALAAVQDRKSTRLNSSHVEISYAVFC